jgi:hypothetical protein
MRSVRETYDLPERPPTPFRQWGFMVAVPVIVLVGWIVLPDSPVAVALLAIASLLVVFAGIAWVLRSRQFSDPPRRNPAPRDTTRSSEAPRS